MFRRWAAGLFLLFTCAKAMDPVSVASDSLAHKPAGALKSADSSLHFAQKLPVYIPVHYRWPIDTTNTVCRDPLEIAEDCWRSSSRWANQNIGFPGARSRTLSLSSMEPVGVNPFFQPALSASPYELGGHMPFDRIEEREGISEVWTPVLPVDTPVTFLHWERGALQLNQFTLNLRRMVGERAYLGLQIHSDHAAAQFYEYSFNVHQPYLAGWGLGQVYSPLKRDSASLVIQDSSHKINALHIRPRLGFWIDSQTVVEVFADWLDNSSSLTNPTNPAQKDSAQRLYPTSFSSGNFGGVLARATGSYKGTAVMSHSGWDRELNPQGVKSAQFSETSSGTLDRLRTEWTSLSLPVRPQVGITLTDASQANVFWLNGAKGSSPSAQAWSYSGNMDVQAHPSWGPLSLDVNANGGLRKRPDNSEERLGGIGGEAELKLPINFKVTGEADWNREVAGDDSLFRWQPALGLYPNPNLRPRTDLHFGGGGTWESRHIGFGASWEEHRYENNWLPRVLPRPDVCLDAELGRYPAERQPLCSNDTLPDSLALALVNYHQEVRDMLHLSMFLALGNWRLSLLNTYLLHNAIQDDRLGFTGLNWQLPERIFKGQLLWRRKLIHEKLGLQTQWDWEWFSSRSVFASDLDGYSRVLKLDEYLALDFTVRMEIQSFLLYFRAMNLNHDRYATEPGVHPPGVNFRFGIDWKLWN